MSSLPVAWGSRTNGSAPEFAIKNERPGDWSVHNIVSKYGKDDLENEDNAPLGWSKRSNAKTLLELSQSTSAAVIAVAEVHDTKNTSIFPETCFLQTAIESNISRESNKAIIGQLEQMQQILHMLSGVVIKMDSKLNNLETTQERILQFLAQKSVRD